jgi:hypothetical protein
MAITLDPGTEERIQREFARGHYGSPAEVGSIETATEFFQQRAAKAKGTGLMHFLVNAPYVTEEQWEREQERTSRRKAS